MGCLLISLIQGFIKCFFFQINVLLAKLFKYKGICLTQLLKIKSKVSVGYERFLVLLWKFSQNFFAVFIDFPLQRVVNAFQSDS